MRNLGENPIKTLCCKFLGKFPLWDNFAKSALQISYFQNCIFFHVSEPNINLTNTLGQKPSNVNSNIASLETRHQPDKVLIKAISKNRKYTKKLFLPNSVYLQFSLNYGEIDEKFVCFEASKSNFLDQFFFCGRFRLFLEMILFFSIFWLIGRGGLSGIFSKN